MTAPTFPPSPAQGETAGVSEKTLDEHLATAIAEYNAAYNTNDWEAAHFWGPIKRALVDIKAARQQLAELHDKDYALSEAEAALVMARQQLAEMRGAVTLSEVEQQGLSDAVAMAVVAVNVATGDEHKKALRMRNTLQNLYGRLTPTSQPSRGKCETFPINGGYVVTEKESSRCIHGVQLVQRGSDGYRACEKCFAFLHPRPDCAQPERQGDAPLYVFGEYTVDDGQGNTLSKRTGEPSPPQDDIVAGLRHLRETLSSRYALNVLASLEPIDRAIAALGEKGCTREAVIRECWDAINKYIKPGTLPGNGCDESAQRNGMILASNVLMEMMVKPSPPIGRGA